jgi:hypothetical protein
MGNGNTYHKTFEEENLKLLDPDEKPFRRECDHQHRRNSSTSVEFVSLLLPAALKVEEVVENTTCGNQEGIDYCRLWNELRALPAKVEKLEATNHEQATRIPFLEERLSTDLRDCQSYQRLRHRLACCPVYCFGCASGCDVWRLRWFIKDAYTFSKYCFRSRTDYLQKDKTK